MIEIAKDCLFENDFSCVVVKDSKVLHSVNGKGIRPLLNLYKSHREDLCESYVADKVIGKAAASFLICAKVKEVFGKIVSESAVTLLKEYNIPVSYDLLIPDILNIEYTDICPMEKLASTSNDPHEIISLINNFLIQ